MGIGGSPDAIEKEVKRRVGDSPQDGQNGGQGYAGRPQGAVVTRRDRCGRP